MARPIEGDSPKSQMLNCKLTADENTELMRVVKESNLSKSKLIRKVLQITFKRAKEARKRVKERAEKMIKDGNFSFDKIAQMNKMLEDELENELNKMAFDLVLEEDKEKMKKKKNNS